jgi:hypothetical protein
MTVKYPRTTSGSCGQEPDLRSFAWQEGYGAFSVGVSQLASTMSYIEDQANHHRAKSYQDEFLAFLKRHGLAYDERFLWG